MWTLLLSFKANDGVFLSVHFFDRFDDPLPLRIGDQIVGVPIFDGKVLREHTASI